MRAVTYGGFRPLLSGKPIAYITDERQCAGCGKVLCRYNLDCFCYICRETHWPPRRYWDALPDIVERITGERFVPARELQPVVGGQVSRVANVVEWMRNSRGIPIEGRSRSSEGIRGYRILP
jgi:hypothetical protein